MIGCLSVAALAIGWVGLEMLGNSGWERLIAFLGLSVAGLALLAVLPHALILRWVRSHRRSPVSPWPTLTAVTATAIPFPATILTISREPPIEFIVPMAIFGMLLAVEVFLMLHLSQRDKSQVGLSSVNHHDDHAEH